MYSQLPVKELYKLHLMKQVPKIDQEMVYLGQKNKDRSCKAHRLKPGVTGRILNLMALTPHCVTNCSIAGHMLISKGQDCGVIVCSWV